MRSEVDESSFGGTCTGKRGRGAVGKLGFQHLQTGWERIRCAKPQSRHLAAGLGSRQDSRDFGQFLRAHSPAHRAHVLLQLFGLGSTSDHTGDGWVRQQLAIGDLRVNAPAKVIAAKPHYRDPQARTAQIATFHEGNYTVNP